ncbi:MAG: pyridoxal phosphate-dependent decarboxylase family protein, partial [Polyangiales bacterium]
PELPPMRLYTSAQAHSSIDKAAIVLGLGHESVRHIPVDADFRMDVHALRAAIQEDRRDGIRPMAVVATVGTTSTTSVDPVAKIAAVCAAEGLWLHVDSAYAGMAALSPRGREALSGCEYADSLVVNPHKWLFTPLDCSILYVRDPAKLQQTFSLVPEYLKTPEHNVRNYMDWGVQLGRRFRALKLWLVLSYFGREGLARRIDDHIEWAASLAQAIDAHPDFERLAPTPFSTVCFRCRPAPTAQDAAHHMSSEALARLNEALLQRVNASGEAYLSHTRVRGEYALRLAIGNLRTEYADVMRCWELIRECAIKVRASMAKR